MKLSNRNLQGPFLFKLVKGSYLCQSRGRGRVWDRGGSRYRLWWFVHFTFFCGSALGWRCVASLSEEQLEKTRKTINYQ